MVSSALTAALACVLPTYFTSGYLLYISTKARRAMVRAVVVDVYIFLPHLTGRCSEKCG